MLGIETSCDETAVAVVEDGHRLLSNVVATSIDLHTVYGGVVPEIAARSHIESMLPVVEEALKQAFGSETNDERQSAVQQVNDMTATSIPNAKPQAHGPVDPWDRIDAIAVTYGAGLGGSLLVGVMTARTLAIVKNKPLYAINHVEAHVYANFLTEIGSKESRVKKQENATIAPRSASLGGKEYKLRTKQPDFPLLALIVSGGHSQLALFNGHFDYTLLGRTRDDAVGEAFDKVAKIIGLPYPGGPSVAAAAEAGNDQKYTFPKARLDLPYDFSFSGVKTAVLRCAQAVIGQDFTFPSFKIAERLSDTQRNDIAASFQRIAIETLVDKTAAAFAEYQPSSVVIAGGVAASSELRKQLAERLPIEIEYPDFKLCTDNGAMVATLGCFKAMHNQPVADPYSLDIAPNLSM